MIKCFLETQNFASLFLPTQQQPSSKLLFRKQTSLHPSFTKFAKFNIFRYMSIFLGKNRPTLQLQSCKVQLNHWLSKITLIFTPKTKQTRFSHNYNKINLLPKLCKLCELCNPLFLAKFNNSKSINPYKSTH